MPTSQKRKVALIGYGFIGSNGHVPAYLQRTDTEIVAVADTCNARQELVKTNLPSARVYSNYQDLIETESELDFIDIATPPCDHLELAICALKKGLHVLCEKPLVLSKKEMKQLMDAVRRNQRIVYPCHNYRHAPVIKAIQREIDSGYIGKIRNITLQTFRPTHARGVKEWKPDWRRSTEIGGGGILMDHGPHSFYLLLHWLASFPIYVTASTFTSDLNSESNKTEDTVGCILRFPNGFAQVLLTWSAGARKVVYTIHGAEGAIFVNDDDMEIIKDGKTVNKYSVKSDWNDASHAGWFNALIDDFYLCIDQKFLFHKELQTAALCVEIMEKCYISAQANSEQQTIDSELAYLRSTKSW